MGAPILNSSPYRLYFIGAEGALLFRALLLIFFLDIHTVEGQVAELDFQTGKLLLCQRDMGGAEVFHHALRSQDIGALAALGITKVPVARKPLVGIISTGDELVPVAEQPKEGQVRDVNTVMLGAAVEQMGAIARRYGIVRDEEEQLDAVVERALDTYDVVLVSGGSSVGTKDATCRVIAQRGRVLLHGIAIKPGKPTILGKVGGKPVIGLPGHPAAAFFVTEIFVRFLLAQLCGRKIQQFMFPAVLTENISANHGRTQYNGVILSQADGIRYARPIHGKSGLITSLAGSDGYIAVPRDREGIAAGQSVFVKLYGVD